MAGDQGAATRDDPEPLTIDDPFAPLVAAASRQGDALDRLAALVGMDGWEVLSFTTDDALAAETNRISSHWERLRIMYLIFACETTANPYTLNVGNQRFPFYVATVSSTAQVIPFPIVVERGVELWWSSPAAETDTMQFYIIARPE